jgi:hypothetical protein
MLVNITLEIAFLCYSRDFITSMIAITEFDYIFKKKAMPKAKLPNGVHVCVQGNGWMDAAMV